MARFKNGNVQVKDNKGIQFGDEQDASITYDPSADAIVFNATLVSGIEVGGTFIGLDDTPESFTGHANKYIRVNSGEDAVEFVSSTSSGLGAVEDDTSPKLGADLDTNNHSIIIKSTVSTDHSCSSNCIAVGTAGESLVFGDVCYFKSDGKYWKSNATTNSGTMPVRAMALETISGSATGNFIVGAGYVRDDSWTWTISGDIYASTTSGSITQTAVSGTGNVHQIIGYAVASGIMFFNPDRTYIVRA
jgi:hypothetical protein